MAKKSNLKKTLLASALSLTLSASMLVGTTFAWFTDSVTNAGNKIQAGTLDIDLYDVANSGTEVEITNESAPLFNYAKWEPGYRASKVLKVKNDGTLALKFKMDIVKTASVGGADICDVIEVWATAPAASYDASNYEWSTDYTYCGTLNQMMAEGDGAIHGTLLEGESAYQGIVLKMSEEAGNEYQGAVAEFDIRLNATQFTYEEDSYDGQYDAGADYFGEASNASSLKAALESGTNVKLLDDIEMTEMVQVPAGESAIIDLNGKTITAAAGTGVIRAYGDLTLAGEGTVEGNVNAYAVRAEAGSTVTVEEGVYIDGGFGAVACPGGTLIVNGGTFTNKEVNSTHYVVSVWNNGKIIINDGSFTFGEDQYASSNGSPVFGTWGGGSIEVYGGEFDAFNGSALCYSGASVTLKGGTYKNAATKTYGGDISSKIPSGYALTKNGTVWSISREYVQAPTVTDKTDKVANGTALGNAIADSTNDEIFLDLAEGEYKMPSVAENKNFTIVGDENTVIDVTLGAYMESSTVAFEGVTIKGSTGKANGNGSDYAALYTPNVTYTNCTFDGPFRIGRDGATFINCKFTNLGNDYVWTYGNDATFIGCTFESEGKALLLYSDGGTEVAKVVVENCVFNATKGAKAGAISNQNCAAIEIDNYGNGVDLVTSGNTIDSDFSGEWRIKSYNSAKPAVIVNGVTYTSLALDGKLMTISGTVVTVQ